MPALSALSARWSDNDATRSDWRIDPVRAAEPYQLKRTVEPSVDAVSVAQAKAYLRIEHSDHDDLLSGIIPAAVDQVEKYTDLALVSQTWEYRLANFSTVITLPVAPLISVTSVKYIDTDGVEQTVSSDDYVVDTYSKKGRIFPVYNGEWPQIRDERSAVRIVFVAGFEDSGASPVDLTDGIPKALTQAIKMIVGYSYEHREASDLFGMGDAVFTLMDLYRKRSV